MKAIIKKLPADPTCPHCLGVGYFGGALFGGQQACYCTRPGPCTKCGGEGLAPGRWAKCKHCHGSGEEPKLENNRAM